MFCEDVAVESLARKFGTPLYVYSQRTLTGHFRRLDAALAPLDHLICFAMKSNSNLSVLRTLANLGAGFDIVSGGELRRVLAAGGDPRLCVFAGVGKTEEEIEFALRQDIYSFNAESEPELQRINRVAARLRKIARVAVRVNPNIEAHTHAKITTGTYENKFGIQFEQVEGVYARASKLKNLRLCGLQMHIGSQLTSVSPFEQAVRKVLPFLRRLKDRYPLEFFSIGGGLGIVYQPALASGAAAWWKSPVDQVPAEISHLGRSHSRPSFRDLRALHPSADCTPDRKPSENKFKCPCHGSGYDSEGINFEVRPAAPHGSRSHRTRARRRDSGGSRRSCTNGPKVNPRTSTIPERS